MINEKLLLFKNLYKCSKKEYCQYKETYGDDNRCTISLFDCFYIESK